MVDGIWAFEIHLCDSIWPKQELSEIFAAQTGREAFGCYNFLREFYAFGISESNVPSKEFLELFNQ